MGRALIKGIRLSLAANPQACEADLRALGLEADTRAPGGSKDASPVRVGAGKGRLHQSGLGNRPCDSLRSAVGWGATDFDLDHPSGPFTIGDDLKRE